MNIFKDYALSSIEADQVFFYEIKFDENGKFKNAELFMENYDKKNKQFHLHIVNAKMRLVILF